MAGRASSKLHRALLQAWHAWLAGGFLVAYLSADEDTYTIHQFAGYAVLAAIAVRLAAGMIAPNGSPLRLPRPSWRSVFDRLANRSGRHPMFAWMGAALLALVGAVSLTGALSDLGAPFEHPHEAIAEASLWLIAAHIGFVTYMYAGRKWWAALSARLSARRKDCAS